MVKSTSNNSNLDDVAEFIVSGSAGDYVFREGDSGTEMFIIEDGEIEILKKYGGSERRLAVLEPGDFFGEMALLEDLPRQASAKASTSFRLLKIDASTFDQVVQENPEIAVRMLRKLARRLRKRQEAELKADRFAREVLVEAEEKEKVQKALREGKASGPRLVHRDTGQEFFLCSSGETTIGRIDRVTGQVPEVNFTDLDSHRSLSRRHAKISVVGGQFYLREEIGTKNGTYVNGEQVKTGVLVKLKDGDKIRFGQINALFRSA